MTECGHCGFDVRRGDDSCPLCGTPVTDDSRGEGGSGRTAPWEDPEIPLGSGLWRTWKQSMFMPGEFFERLAWDAPLWRPIFYYLLLGVASAFFSLLWIYTGVSDPAPGMEMGLDPRALGLFVFFLSPFIGLFILAFQTLVYHLFVALLVRDRRSLSATARVVAYSVGPAAFTLVPFLGAFMAAIWTPVLTVFGVRAAHRTTTGRAVAVVLLPLGVAVALVIGLVILVVVAVSGLTEI